MQLGQEGRSKSVTKTLASDCILRKELQTRRDDVKQMITSSLMGVLLIACGGNGIDASQLPKHTIQESSLGAKGLRIQINVHDSFLPKADCENLINYYKSRAEPSGQVSIRGPSAKLQKLFPDDPKSKEPQVWAYDNLDGTGIHYNDLNYGRE